MDNKKILNQFNKKANEWLVDLRMMDEEVFKLSHLRHHGHYQRYMTM